MGNAFSAEIESIRGAAQGAAEAADLAGRVSLSETVVPIGPTLPGSRSAAGAASLSGTWRATLTAWCDDTATYASDLRASADGYGASDDRAAADLSGLRGGTGGGMRAE